MDNVGVYLEQSNKKDFLDYAQKVLDFQRGSGESFYDYVPCNSSVFWNHKNGKYDVMPFKLFSRIFSINYGSEPRYRISKPTKLVENVDLESKGFNEESLKHLTENTIRVRPRNRNKHIFEFVFSHYTLEELSSRYGGSTDLFKNWRRGKTETVDYRVFKQICDDIVEFYSEKPTISPDLVDRNKYKGNSLEESKIIRNLDLNEIALLELERPEKELIEPILEDFNEWWEKYDRESIFGDTAWYIKWVKPDFRS